MELNEKDLENIMGGIPKEMVDDIALENKDLFREKQIEDLKVQREIIAAMKQVGTTELTEETPVPKF